MVMDRPTRCGICDRGIPSDIPPATQIAQFSPAAGAVENAAGTRAPRPFQLVRQSGRVIDSRSERGRGLLALPMLSPSNGRFIEVIVRWWLKLHSSSTCLSLELLMPP